MPAPATSTRSARTSACARRTRRARARPQTKTAYVFGASTTSSISTPRSFAAAMCSSAESTSTARWLSSGCSGAPALPGNSTQAPPTSTRGQPDGPGGAAAKPSEPYSAAVSSGFAREERDMVEVVLDVRRRLDETEAHAFGDVEVRLALARRIDREPVRQFCERVVEPETRSATCSSAPRSRGLPRRRASACRGARSSRRA